jgi:hypothetical protein
VLHQRFWSELPRADGAKVEANIWRGNLDEDLIELVILAGLLMLLRLIQSRIFVPSIETCKKSLIFH